MTEDPDKASSIEETLPRRRSAGVCLHFTSLPGCHGIGEIGGAARDFIDTMVAMDLRVWQFLATGPTGHGDSPYQPLSTFAGNEMLIDVSTLIREGLVTSNQADCLVHLPVDHVDYGRLLPAKKHILERAAGQFGTRAKATAKADFDRFVDATDRLWLHEYALYRTIKSLHHELPWLEWESRYAQREQSALREIESKFAEQIERIKITQFIFFQQWQRLHAYATERGIRLFGDMPICIAMDSADSWAGRDLLCLDGSGHPTHVVGVPPDYFSEEGQLWGNPVYDWRRHAETGYGWWVERLHAAAAMADIVRIDHFRGFEAYWSIPAGSPHARTGEWVPGPGDAIFDAMQRELGHVPIVAEDLGVITPEVEALRDRHGIPGMKVLQFEVSYMDFDLASITENSVCYTGTHDNDTTIGWFLGTADDTRSEEEVLRTQRQALEITNGTPETIHHDMTRLAMAADSRLAVIPMQDFLGLGTEGRMNTPGTLGNNWRWRLLEEQLTPELLDMIGNMVAISGRDR